MENQSAKPRRKGKGAMGPEWGVDTRFSSTNQPPKEKKMAGIAKKKFTRQLLKDMLNLPYKFAPESQIKQQLIKAFGKEIENMSIGEIMSLQQAQKAVLKSDSGAYMALLNQAFGLPKQDIDLSTKEVIEVEIS